MRLLLKSTDQILAELIQARAGEQCVLRPKNVLILFEIRKELSQQWKEYLNVPIYKKTDCSKYTGYHYYQLHTKL